MTGWNGKRAHLGLKRWSNPATHVSALSTGLNRALVMIITHLYLHIPINIECVSTLNINITNQHVTPTDYYLHRLTNLIKTECVDSSTEVDSWRTDAKDTTFLESILCVHRANCHGGWEGWWNNDRDDV